MDMQPGDEECMTILASRERKESDRPAQFMDLW
jgi:hypothetical protein